MKLAANKLGIILILTGLFLPIFSLLFVSGYVPYYDVISNINNMKILIVGQGYIEKRSLLQTSYVPPYFSGGAFFFSPKLPAFNSLESELVNSKEEQAKMERQLERYKEWQDMEGKQLKEYKDFFVNLAKSKGYPDILEMISDKSFQEKIKAQYSWREKKAIDNEINGILKYSDERFAAGDSRDNVINHLIETDFGSYLGNSIIVPEISIPFKLIIAISLLSIFPGLGLILLGRQKK